MSNSQLNKLKSAIKNGTEAKSFIKSDESSNDKTNFLHILLLTDTQVPKPCKGFAKDSSANIKFSKTHLSKVILSRGILGDLIAAIPQVMFISEKETSQNVISIARKLTRKLAEKATKYYIFKGINDLDKMCTSNKGSGITLKDNEI